MIGANVRKFCSEDISLIENYNEAVSSPEHYICHHRLGITLNKSAEQLNELGLYYNRPASELIFLTISEHRTVHNYIKDNNGEKNGMFGKHHTDEAKEKQRQKRIEYFQNSANREHMSEIAKNREYTQERRNNISKALKGVKKTHYTNPKKIKIISDLGEIREYRKSNAIQFIKRHKNENWRFLEED